MLKRLGRTSVGFRGQNNIDTALSLYFPAKAEKQRSGTSVAWADSESNSRCEAVGHPHDWTGSRQLLAATPATSRWPPCG